MRETRPYGSVRGAVSDGRPYRNSQNLSSGVRVAHNWHAAVRAERACGICFDVWLALFKPDIFELFRLASGRKSQTRTPAATLIIMPI